MIFSILMWKKRSEFYTEPLCIELWEFDWADVVLEKAKPVALNTGTLPKTQHFFRSWKFAVFSQESPNFQGAPILRGKLAVSFREGYIINIHKLKDCSNTNDICLPMLAESINLKNGRWKVHFSSQALSTTSAGQHRTANFWPTSRVYKTGCSENMGKSNQISSRLRETNIVSPLWISRKLSQTGGIYPSKIEWDRTNGPLII